MTKQEFEDRYGAKIDDSQYATVERMYKALPNVDKDEFCSLMKNNTDEVCGLLVDRIKELEDIVNDCRESLDVANKQRGALAVHLLVKSNQYNDKEMHDKAVELVGQREVVKIALEIGCKLWASDRDYLAALLGCDTE